MRCVDTAVAQMFTVVPEGLKINMSLPFSQSSFISF